MSAENLVLPRILRDMNDGVLALDRHGKILFLNPKAQALLGLSENPVGRSYASALMTDENQCNDGFHQFVLDAVYEKETNHTGQVVYTADGQNKRTFELTSSFLKSDDGTQDIGVIVVFSDITEVEHLRRQRAESSVVFSILIVCICGYLLFWSVLREFHIEIPLDIMTQIIHAIAIVMLIVMIKTTSFTLADIGLKINSVKGTFVPAIAISAIGVAAMIGVKAILLRISPGFFPEGAPFFDWNEVTVIYIFTAILQEFLARGAMQDNLRRIFTGKHADALAIVISSLIFGVLHIAFGLMYMLGAMLLLGALGVLYYKQKNIWGLALIHYVLGTFGTVIGLL